MSNEMLFRGSAADQVLLHVVHELLFRLSCLTFHLIVRNKASSICDAKNHDASVTYEFAFVR